MIFCPPDSRPQPGGDSATGPSRDAIFCQIQLKRNSMWGIGRFAASIVLFAVSYRVYLSFLNLELFGLWILFTTIVFYLQFGAFNLPWAVAKLISENLARGELLETQRYAASAVAAIVASSLGILALVYLGRDMFSLLLPAPPDLRPHLPGFLLLAAILTSQAMLAETLGGVVSGLGRMDWSYQLDVLRQVLTFSLAVALLYQGLGVTALFVSHILGYLTCAGAAALLAGRGLNLAWWNRSLISWAHLKQLVRFATPLAGGSLLNLLMQPFNRLLVGYAISLPAVSVYDIADRASQTVRAPVEAALRPYMPQMSGLAAQNDTARIRRQTFRLIRMVILWATPFFIIMFISADQVIRLWLGSLAVPEISLNLRIIMWGYFANMLSIPVYNAFLGMGQAWKCFKIHLIQTFLNIIIATLGMFFIRKVWVISLAVVIALSIASFDMIINFMAQQGQIAKECRKAINTFIIPVVVFSPLFFLYGRFTYFVIAAMLVAGVYFLTIFYVTRSREQIILN